jgi:hypothetical protein
MHTYRHEHHILIYICACVVDVHVFCRCGCGWVGVYLVVHSGAAAVLLSSEKEKNCPVVHVPMSVCLSRR